MFSRLEVIHFGAETALSVVLQKFLFVSVFVELVDDTILPHRRVMTSIITSVFALLSLVLPIVAYLPEFEVVFSEAELTVARVAALDHHNLRRCMHNAPPLALDHKVNLEAQDYAERLARENRIEHSKTEDMGENIGVVATYNEPVNVSFIAVHETERFYGEWVNYKGSAAGAGHFTQLAWKDTKFLGIGLATYTYFNTDRPSVPITDTLVVANYLPPGNVEGDYAENVEGLPSKSEEECRRILKRMRRSGSGRNSVPIRFGVFSLALLLLTAWH